MICTKCSAVEAQYSLGREVVCNNCLENASLQDAVCPNCGQTVNMQT